jgi:hypothetical protein
LIQGKDVYGIVKEKLAKETYRLENARLILMGIDPNIMTKH